MRRILSWRVASGFSWPECPRWDGAHFFFSDMYGARVVRVDEYGRPSSYRDLSGRSPLGGGSTVAVGSGLRADGSLLLVSMYEQLVLAVDADGVRVHADLRDLAVGPVNDMVVDGADRAYVSQLGSDVIRGEPVRTSSLLLIDVDGARRELVEAGPFAGANGLAISADGRTLVVSEQFAKRILAFDIAADATLTGRRVVAELDAVPDGLCLDAEGGVWVAFPGRREVIRFDPAGAATDVVTLEPDAGMAIACVLGGPDRRTLMICAGVEVADATRSRREGQGSIWMARVDVGGGAARP